MSVSFGVYAADGVKVCGGVSFVRDTVSCGDLQGVILRCERGLDCHPVVGVDIDNLDALCLVQRARGCVLVGEVQWVIESLCVRETVEDELCEG